MSRNLHLKSKQGDVLIDTESRRLELEGEGEKLLNLPECLSNATLQDGLPVLRGSLPPEGLRLHHAP